VWCFWWYQVGSTIWQWHRIIYYDCV